jgi:hypothetical protein
MRPLTFKSAAKKLIEYATEIDTEKLIDLIKFYLMAVEYITRVDRHNKGDHSKPGFLEWLDFRAEIVFGWGSYIDNETDYYKLEKTLSSSFLAAYTYLEEVVGLSPRQGKERNIEKTRRRCIYYARLCSTQEQFDETFIWLINLPNTEPEWKREPYRNIYNELRDIFSHTIMAKQEGGDNE